MKLYAPSALVVLVVSCIQPAHAVNSHLKTRIENNEKRIKKIDIKIEKLSEDSNANKKDIQKNKKDIEINKGSIAINKKKIDNNEGNIINNKKRIDDNSADIKRNNQDTGKNSLLIDDNRKNITINTRRLDGFFDDYDLFKKDTNRSFQNMDKKIDKNHRKALAGVSSAMAMSSIPPVEGKVVSMGVGGGSYGGQSALAFGSKFKIGGKASASTALSYDSQRNLGVAAGLAIGW